MQKRQIDAVSIHQHAFPPLQTTYTRIIGVCKYFYAVQS